MRELFKYKIEDLLFFDIETASVEASLSLDSPLFDSWSYKCRKDNKDITDEETQDRYQREAALFPEFSKVVCVVVGKVIKGKIALVKITGDGDEKVLLTKMNDLLDRNPKSQLAGFFNKGFDTPFLMKRMIINGIKPHDSIDSSGLKPWELSGIDLCEMWRSTSYNKASLTAVATSLGLPSPKDALEGSEVSGAYWDGRLDEIVEYCSKDVVTTVNIFRKCRLEDPLEVMGGGSKAPESKLPLIESLFAGGSYTKREESSIKSFLEELTEEEAEKAVTILSAMCSAAKGKKTKMTKAALKKIKEGLNE